MVLAILMGLVGHLCAAFITIFGGFAVLDLLGFATPVALKTTFVCVLLFALVRGIFRYAEQSCNHFIAFIQLCRRHLQTIGFEFRPGNQFHKTTLCREEEHGFK